MSMMYFTSCSRARHVSSRVCRGPAVCVTSVFSLGSGALPGLLLPHVPVDGRRRLLRRHEHGGSEQTPGQAHLQALPELPGADREERGLPAVRPATIRARTYIGGTGTDFKIKALTKR